MFLLDTNVVSAARRLHKQESAFQAFMRKFRPQDASLSAITIMEIQFGIQIAQPRDPAFAAELDRWLNGELGRFVPHDHRRRRDLLAGLPRQRAFGSFQFVAFTAASAASRFFG